jgi:cholesterol transport system auxiliary component
MLLLRPLILALATAALLPGCSAISALSGAATPLDAYDHVAPAGGRTADSTRCPLE